MRCDPFPSKVGRLCVWLQDEAQEFFFFGQLCCVVGQVVWPPHDV